IEPPPMSYSGQACQPWHAQSYYLPSLCRYGLVAPRMPGSESVHSAYTVQPPCGPPSPCATLFGPPPCGGCDQCATGQGPAPAPPVCDAPCIDRRAQLSQFSTSDFS